MSWSHTIDAYRRLKDALREADEDTRYEITFWAFGLAAMGYAICAEFGLRGMIFCGGFIIWASSNSRRGNHK